jgi:adenosylhomocysteine nucleosidase
MRMSHPVCIIGAMDEEISEFLAHGIISRKSQRKCFCVYEASLFDYPVIIIKCGVGKVFASLITQYAIGEYQPSAVISTGVAGSLSEKLSIGDVVVSSDCVHHDMDARALGFERGRIPYTEARFFAADKNLAKSALSADLESRDHKIVSGRILTGDQFISGVRGENHRYLTEELKGMAVDMETAAIGQVCFVNEIPFVSVRTISDNADHEAHIDFNKFLPIVASNSFHIVKHVLRDASIPFLNR